MKSLAELKAIREKAKDSVIMRHENPNNIRVVVGMATCGIAAGARPVLQAFLEEVQKRGWTTSSSPRPAASACAGLSLLSRSMCPARKR